MSALMALLEAQSNGACKTRKPLAVACSAIETVEGLVVGVSRRQ